MVQIVIEGAPIGNKKKSLLKNACARTLKALRVKNRSLRVFVLPGREMSAVKRIFFPKKRGPADVYAFPEPRKFPYPEENRFPLGEIYLNETICRADLNRAVFLLIHGILHLRGYDHKKKRDILKMEKAEQKLLQLILRRQA